MSALLIGTVRFTLTNTMGMPLDSGVCEECGAQQSYWGEKSYARLKVWAEAHSATHASGTDASAFGVSS